MAVAVKTSPGSRSGTPLVSPAIISLVGVLYLLGCLGIVFKLLPGLWWTVWNQADLQRFQFVGGSLLVVVGLAVTVGLLVLGGKLLGPNPPVGVRSGVFVAFGGFVIALLLARWASLWLEHWAYDSRWFSAEMGEIAAAVVGLLLLVGWVRLFTRPAVQKFVLMVEHGGWFHASAYKPNQGQKVRRGTIFGILLLVGAGIYTLISHNTLAKGFGKNSPDWSMNIPFTGAMAINSYGDAEPFLTEMPLSAKDRVSIRLPGKTNLKPNEIVSFQTYKDKVAEVLTVEAADEDKQSVEGSPRPDAENSKKKELLAKDDPVEHLEKVNKAIHDRMELLLGKKKPKKETPGKEEVPFFKEDAVRRL